MTPPLQVTEGDSSSGVDDKDDEDDEDDEDDKDRAQMSRSLLRPILVNIAGYYPVNGTGSPINVRSRMSAPRWANRKDYG